MRRPIDWSAVILVAVCMSVVLVAFWFMLDYINTYDW